MSYLIEPLKVNGAANIKFFRVNDQRALAIFPRKEDKFSDEIDFKGIKNVYLSQNIKSNTLRGFQTERTLWGIKNYFAFERLFM